MLANILANPLKLLAPLLLRARGAGRRAGAVRHPRAAGRRGDRRLPRASTRACRCSLWRVGRRAGCAWPAYAAALVTHRGHGARHPLSQLPARCSASSPTS
ncbi:MAG: hypothetical protein MZW92_34335 [Comamonadaceae bacterium]|nr:hypothetical protein [Comamonadaceae bacterium]